MLAASIYPSESGYALPVSEGVNDASYPITPQRSAVRTRAGVAALRICLVDASPERGEQLADILAELGHTVVRTRALRETVVTLAQLPYDVVVIADMVTSKQSLVTALRHSPSARLRNLPVMLLSDSYALENDAQLLASGADAIISYDVTTYQFDETLLQLCALGKHRRLRADEQKASPPATRDAKTATPAPPQRLAEHTDGYDPLLGFFEKFKAFSQRFHAG
jgi:CheY-like chemotaxis protein